MTVGEGRYSAVGFCSAGMRGPMLACFVPPAGDAGGAVCADFVGTDFDVAPRRPSVSWMVGWGRARQPAGGGGVGAPFGWAVVRVRAAAVGVAPLASGADARLAFSSGPWARALSMPRRHDAQGARRVAFYEGALKEASTGARTTGGFVVATVGSAAVVAVGAGLRWRDGRGGVALAPRAALVSDALTAALHAALLCVVVVLSYSDYRDDGKTMPAGRALGNGVVYCFFLVLLPLPRFVGVGPLLGVPFPAFLSLHRTVGLALFALMTAHFGVVLKTFAVDADNASFVFGAGGGTRNNAAGFVAWCFAVVAVVPAVLLRRRAYFAFRLTHLSAVGVVVAACVHHRPLVFFLIPGLVGLAADYVCRARATVAHRAAAAVATAVPDPTGAAAFVALRVSFPAAGGGAAAAAPAPFQFCWLSVPAVAGVGASPLHQHPFSPAHVDPKDGSLTFFVRVVGPFTKRLAAVALRGSSHGGARAAAAAASAGAPPSGVPLGRVFVQGPCGGPSLPLSLPVHVVAVCGGVGVAPMARLLQVLAAPNAAAKFGNVARVSFLWAVRERALVEAVMDGGLAASVVALAAQGGRRQRVRAFLLRVCRTGRPEPGDRPDGSVGSSAAAREAAPRIVWEIGGRPDVASFLQEACLAPQMTRPVGVYVCGPSALTREVVSFCSEHGVMMHAESSEL